MQVLPEETKFAVLGKPGTAFSQGFRRRLERVEEYVDLTGKKILDVGTGEGVWLSEFARITGPENVFGTDIDAEFLEAAAQQGIPQGNLRVSPAEQLPWPEAEFDVVFSNEVLEHVKDDKQVLAEMVRVLRPGGYLIFFTPNRGWPFETHGMFVGGKYVWGNIPLLPWMPRVFRTKLSPHVRNYSNADIARLLEPLGLEVVAHTHVFPGFDGLTRRFGVLGRIARKGFHSAEQTPLHYFGISHLVVARKGA